MKDVKGPSRRQPTDPTIFKVAAMAGYYIFRRMDVSQGVPLDPDRHILRLIIGFDLQCNTYHKSMQLSHTSKCIVVIH